jgi:integrase
MRIFGSQNIICFTVLTALHTGMRRGEILKLTWEQVDLTHGFITLTDTKNGEGREVPIDSTLRETFNRLPRCFVEVVKEDGKDGEGKRTCSVCFS